MSIVPPEAPVGKPKPMQALVEEMIKTVARMREEVEQVARKSRWDDLNFLIPFEVPAGRVLENRLRLVTTALAMMKEVGIGVEQLAATARAALEEAIKPRTTAQAGMVRPITPVSGDFVEGIMDLARWSNSLSMVPALRGYARRIIYDVMMLISLLTYRAGKPVLMMSPADAYSKLVAIEGILQFVHPLTLGGRL